MGKPKYQRPKTAARKSVNIEVEAGRQRQILLDVGLAKKAARSKTTQLKKGYYMPGKGSAEYQRQATSLKNGVLGMGTRANIDAELYDKLLKMDESKLKYLYDHNEFVFDVYFQYEGINYADGQYTVLEGAKEADTRFLIEQYERAFGKL